VNRAQLQKLVEVRVSDAAYLLVAQRWEAAYYLLGYAVERALKSCVLRYQHETGVIFQDRMYAKGVTDCWTHDFAKLVKLAGLKEQLDVDRGADPNLDQNWTTAEEWSETSRYKLPTQQDARELYDAVTHETNGVLQWVRAHW
jgi:hypothetical protein